MPNEGLLKAQKAIESELKRKGEPVKPNLLLKEIRVDLEGVREIELRGAVWALIESGKVSLTRDWELELASQSQNQPSIK